MANGDCPVNDELLPHLYPRRKAIEVKGNNMPQIILTGFVRPEKD